MKKRLILVVLVLVLLVPTLVHGQEGQINIRVDGKLVESDVDPFIKEGRTMVPVRFVVEALGGEVGYDKGDKFDTVTVQGPYNVLPLILRPGYPLASISEGFYRSDVTPVIVGDRTFLPVRFIGDYLCYDVGWDNKTRTVILERPKGDPQEIIERSADKFTDLYWDQEAYEAYGRWLLEGHEEVDPKLFE